MLVAYFTATDSGTFVRSLARSNLENWALANAGATSKHTAEAWTAKIHELQGITAIIRETTMDRFMGYPSAEDKHVPFRDIETGQPKYPLQASSKLPLDWEYKPNINMENIEEHLGLRSSEYADLDVSTSSAVIRMQGACDPSVTDPGDKRYSHNCTAEHNNIEQGGKIAPTEVFATIHSKASDYATAVLKPLYEQMLSVRKVGIYFANDGAGASVVFPAVLVDGRHSHITQHGCDWMREPNPLDPTRPIGTEDQIAKCHPAGAEVPNREYNPLEQAWCKEQAMNPNSSQIFGPYYDALEPDVMVMTFGQAVYDRITKDFIGCTLADVPVTRIEDTVQLYERDLAFQSALVRWDPEGTVVASSYVNVSDGMMNITQLGEMAVTADLWEHMRDEFLQSWGENFNRTEYDPSCTVEDHFFSGYPVPVPPDEYDPTYQPQLFYVLSITRDLITERVDELDGEVEARIDNLIWWTLSSGFIGISCVLLIVYFVSVYLTKPMYWMNNVGERIVRSVGSHQQDEINCDESSWLRYSPKTEISALVVEFQKMVKKFSGSGTAKIYRQREMEIQNPFDLVNNFASLYESRTETSLKFAFSTYSSSSPRNPSQDDKSTSQFSMRMPWRKHWGPNMEYADDSTDSNCIDLESGKLAKDERRTMKSALYWWIFVSIAIPLLAIMLAIAIHVQFRVSVSLPEVVEEVEKTYISLNLDALNATAKIRAMHASGVLSSYLRDLHLYYRITGWLLFGALQRSSTFTKMTSLTDHCKNQPKNNCSYDPSLAVCDCAWSNKWNVECQHYDEDTRNLQYQWYITSSEDTFPNGDRNSTSYPELADSPATTAWVHNTSAVAGAAKGSGAAGYDTTYDRLRVEAAASMISIPLLNYDMRTSLESSTGVYSAFERDGTFLGYSGCENFHTVAAFFLSDPTTTNSNFTHLCPHGKYGFDPRCRDWYAMARQKALSKKDGDLLHVTPPFVYGSTEEKHVASTATTSWIDPKTNEYVGQALIDIDPSTIIQKLNQEQTPLVESGFHVLITTKPDQFSTDTIVGPDFDFGTNFSKIQDLLLPYDTCDKPESTACHNRKFFEQKVLSRMQQGYSCQTSFLRHSAPDGEREELVYLSYAPIEVLSLRPVDPSNVESGVKMFKSVPLSLGLGATRPGLQSSFASLEGQLERRMFVSILVMSLLMFIAFVVVACITTKVVSSIIYPVSQLLDLVQRINKCEIIDDFPFIHGGSSEVSKVRETFERLYMVMRFANSAFFAGDLLKAYDTLKDALALFTKLKNSKAIGVANNNLGNTMLTMYRAMKRTRSQRMYGLTRRDVIEKGMVYFKAAVDFGEMAIAKINEEEGWSTNYLIYMQQLSNRYFNRGIFLLNVKDDHPNPEEAERQGFMDLSTAKDMDREVVDNGDQQGFKGDLGIYFDLLLSRIKGLLQLLDMGYPDEWGLRELFDDARKELVTALDQENHVLFQEMLPPAQMQRLDAALIDYYRLSEERCPQKAAEIAVRMMVEDEYVMTEAAAKAIKALIEYTDQVTAEDLGGQDPSNVKAALYQLRKHIQETISLKRDVHDLVSKEMFRQSNVGDFFMEEW